MSAVQRAQSTSQRRANPYWLKEFAQSGIDVLDIDEAAASTSTWSSPDITGPLAKWTLNQRDRKLERIIVTAPSTDHFNVASGQVCAVVSGATTWLPYEMAYSRALSEFDLSSQVLSSSYAHGADFIFQSQADRIYTLPAERSASLLLSGHHSSSGWISCFSEEAPTQAQSLCLAYSVPLSRATDPGAELNRVIEAIRKLPDIGQAVAQRLAELVTQRAEETDAAAMSAESVHGLYSALYAARNLDLPRITLSGDGNVYATWKVEKDRVFSVHFLPNGECRYVLIRPDPSSRGSKLVKSTGTLPAHSVFSFPETSAASWVYK